MVMVKVYLSLLALGVFASAQGPETGGKYPIPKQILQRDDRACADLRNRINLPQCDWHYIAYFPRIFRSGVTENVIFATHGFPNDVVLDVRAVEATNGRVIATNKQTVEPGKLVSVPLRIPHKAPLHVKVELKGSGEFNETTGWQFKNKSSNIRVENLGLNILIQTDRPLYKPGQLIRSRVVVIDSKLKPYNGTLDSVVIENPSGSIMRMWKDVQLEEGFASFELKTSVKPVIGKWKIKATTKSYKKELVISVKKYVLPKFQVTLEPPAYFTEMMKSTTVDVCAKYSYGKKVSGKMNATVCLEKKPTYSYLRNKRTVETCIDFNKQIDGCTTLSINLAKMKGMLPPLPKARYYSSYYDYHINLRGSVTEKATGVMLSSSTVQKKLLRDDVELSIESKEVFKPSFPLSVKLVAKHPDDTPVKSVNVLLKVECNGILKPLVPERTVRIQNGFRNIDLPSIPLKAKNVRVYIHYYREKARKDEQKWRTKVSASKTIKPWYSPSHSYLDVQKVETPVTIGSTLEVTAGYTIVDAIPIERKISYSMMCGGNLVKSDSFSTTFSGPNVRTRGGKGSMFRHRRSVMPWWRPIGPSATRPPLPDVFSTDKFKFSIQITRNMLPSCRLVVYYVRQEEVVADETYIKVVNEFENQVTMRFDKNEVIPGKPVKLIVKGAPSSRIAVAAVDKSIHFLSGGNDIKQQRLIDIREKLTIAPGYVSEYDRCPRRWGRWGRFARSIWPGHGSSNFVDSEKAFANIGVMILSSMRIDVRPCEQSYLRFKVPMSLARPTGVRGPIRTEISRKGGSGNRRPKPVPKTTKKTKKAPKKTVRPRTEFPETWLWTEERLPENGSRVFDVRVPDSITTWYASGFGVSKSAGLGVANPTELRAFQPFFISLTLPYSVIRGEDVTIPAAVFSYLTDTCITVRTTLERSDDYKIIAGPSGKACLCGGKTATVLFRIKPKKLGHIKIRVSAESLTENVCLVGRPFSAAVSAGDVVVKKLLVEAEGTKDEYTRSAFFCPNNEPKKEFKTTLDLRLPANLVSGSLFARVEAMGDIMGSSLSNVDELLAMPYGCGEQNMLKFAPNIFIMNYLNNTHQVDGEITTKALDYMRTGYQRELTYRHDDGSYSAFGKRDDEGSTWLSAFVLKSYAQARPWIEVDEKEIRLTGNWLKKAQGNDGCFRKIGKLHNKAMAGGVKTSATLSAYVLVSLLEADFQPNSTPIMNAARCVSKVFDELNSDRQGVDSYSLSIMAYMFAKLKDMKYYRLAVKYLKEKAIDEDGMTHWEEEKKEKETKGVPSYYRQARSTDIEQTAYVLLARLAGEGKRAINEVVPIVKWLSKQRNSLGGWSSTQDTVLAMQALAEFAELTFSPGANMDVAVKGGAFEHNFQITSANKLVLQRVENVPVPLSLEVTGKGAGCALIKADVKYNVEKVVLQPTFVLLYEVKSINNALTQRRSCRSQIVKACAFWIGKGEESNMAIIDVQMISGFIAEEEQFSTILDSDKLNLKDIETKEKSVIFYFRKIGKKPQCVSFRVDQTTTVRDARPAPIKVYDYYDKDKSTTVMYNFMKEHCEGKAKV